MQIKTVHVTVKTWEQLQILKLKHKDKSLDETVKRLLKKNR